MLSTAARAAFVLLLVSAAGATTGIEQIVSRVRAGSFPQLRDEKISVQPLTRRSDYLRARFTIPSFFFARRLRYRISFDRRAESLGVPPEGLRAIVAHELAHINYYRSRRRLALLGLVRLVSPAFTARFEIGRQADMEALSLGYGPGLKLYRAWLYRHIPAKSVPAKRRNYFSPEEIEAILESQQQQHPDLSMADIVHRAQPRPATSR